MSSFGAAKVAVLVLASLSAIFSLSLVLFIYFVIKGRSFIAKQIMRMHMFLVIELFVAFTFALREENASITTELCNFSAYLYYMSALGILLQLFRYYYRVFCLLFRYYYSAICLILVLLFSFAYLR